MSAAAASNAMKHPFGRTPAGEAVALYTLSAGSASAVVTNYGATLVSLSGPDRHGAAADVVLGFDSLEAYVAGRNRFGATIGRYANRIGGGRFSLDGVSYALPCNSGPHHLHGGPRGF